MRSYFSLLLAISLIACIVCPAFAESYTLTGYQEFNVFDVKKDSYSNVRNLTFDKSKDNQAITLIHFKTQMDRTVSFTIWYGAGNSASGTATTAWNTSLLPLHTTTSTLVFDGTTKEYSYLDTNPEFDYFLSGYARGQETNATGIIVYNAGYGSFDNDLAIFKSVPNLAANLIYRVDISSDAPFDADISYGSSDQVASTVSKTTLDVLWEWINFAISLGSLVLGFAGSILYLLKFFFIDNLLLIIALWLSVTMAYSAISSKNIFGFYKKFLGLQRTLFEFIVAVWTVLIDVISKFVSIFKLS